VKASRQNDLVPEDFRANLISRLMGLTVVRGRAFAVTTVRDAVEWPKLEGGNARYTSAVRVTWVDEIPASATTAQTNPTFGMLRIPVHTVMARTDLSRNLLEDSAFNLLDVVAQLFAEAMAVDEDEQFLIGTGGGRPRGILGKRTGANVDPDDGITAVNSGSASALTADGLIDLAYGIDSQYRNGANFVMAKNTVRDIRKLKDGNGDYLWQRGLQPGEPDLLLGYPLLESEAMPAVGANNHPIIHGNLRGYMIVDRVGMAVERVQDTTTVGTNKVALFARRRLGGNTIQPYHFNVQKVSA
jgi:HK97 family phage major capsid protein